MIQVKKIQKFVSGLPVRICRLGPEAKKINRNTKSTNQNKHFPTKTMFSTLTLKRSQKFELRIFEGICRGGLKVKFKKP
jgi:hypothetical protein